MWKRPSCRICWCWLCSCWGCLISEYSRVYENTVLATYFVSFNDEKVTKKKLNKKRDVKNYCFWVVLILIFCFLPFFSSQPGIGLCVSDSNLIQAECEAVVNLILSGGVTGNVCCDLIDAGYQDGSQMTSVILVGCNVIKCCLLLVQIAVTDAENSIFNFCCSRTIPWPITSTEWRLVVHLAVLGKNTKIVGIPHPKL